MKVIWRICFLFCTIVLLEATSIEEAFEAYSKGEQSENLIEREKYFNLALKRYSELEGESAKLYFNIANCYYQLGQKGMAIWYYHKAQLLDPRNAKIDQNLMKARAEAQLETPGMERVWSSIFFFHTKVLSKEKKVILYVFSILLFLTASLFIWLRRTFLLTLAVLFCGPLTLFGFSLTMDMLNRYTKAILVQPTLLRCDAGEYYEKVSDRLEYAGQKVRILELSSDKKWVRIKTNQKQEGYVQAEKIRIL